MLHSVLYYKQIYHDIIDTLWRLLTRRFSQQQRLLLERWTSGGQRNDTSHYITLHYIMLCYIISYYIILYCIILLY